MIETEHLTRSYGARKAVDGLTFSVPGKQVVGFLGPNGAGKSTTLKILAGFLPPSSGVARIDGYDVVEASLEARRRLGYMPETAPLYPELRVREYLSFRAELKGVTRDRKKAVDRALELTDITDMQHRLIGELSKGYRQRVGLADAIVARPPLLILDEPTEGLDPNQVLKFRALLKDLAREATVFLSTHILSEVEAVCSHVVIIDRGRIAAQGPLSEVLAELQGAGRLVKLAVRLPEGLSEEALRALLKGIDGVVVESVEREGALGRCALRVPSGEAEAAALEAVVRACVGAELGVRELTPQARSLERVFQALTEPKSPSAERPS
ncbi:MAG: ATP-binding cassette domain-containing protein [Deltaproteobacteria bacterium]|nr:ATP-binding cassette domain-containing protein [Deltaproteobacteria bacterium]